jgi:hypothetical protein
VAAIDDYSGADYHFYKLGVQYYIAGRFAAMTALTPVAGNLLHHAVEMFFKGRLAHRLTLDQMASRPYGHVLPRIWQEFKGLFHDDLSGFDGLIQRLHAFDTLRYPDDILECGAHISIGFVSGDLVAGHSPMPNQPVYQLSVTDLDALVSRIFDLCHINPEAYFAPYKGAMEFVKRHNESCSGWFSENV